ncbi:MAG: PRC-barrel domain-containing protein [Hyphomicrobiaceae bacterium]
MSRRAQARAAPVLFFGTSCEQAAFFTRVATIEDDRSNELLPRVSNDQECNMKKLVIMTLAAALSQTVAANAQTQTAPAPRTTVQPAAPSATAPATAMREGKNLTLSESEAKAWINKVVYSSDNKNLGEVAAFARDSSGKVTEMHADIGGFLGIGETRVRIKPDQFSLVGDKVVLNMTADQAKSLPRLPK